MRFLTGSARLAGVAGWPISHSRSPRIHTAWLDRHGIDGAYVPLAVRPADFAGVVKALAAAGFKGLNVTIPHKEAALGLCDEVDETARLAGAVNTLVFADGRILGRNTDGYGFLANLRAHGVKPDSGPALILGAGGAARAIAAALQSEGAAVTFCNRTDERAERLAAATGAAVIPWAQKSAAVKNFALLVNTTALGMLGQPPLSIDLSGAPAPLVVADIVYAPLETPLLAQANSQGKKPVEGLGMLLHQAVPGFAAWFGITPIVDSELYAIVAG